MPSQMQKPFMKQTCERCSMGYYIETAETGDWWLQCVDCGALKFCYVPMDHQYDFHLDGHKYKMFAGGYG